MVRFIRHVCKLWPSNVGIESPRIIQYPCSRDRGDLGVNDKKTKNSGVMIAAFAAVAAWQIYDMSTTTESPSRALAILQYVLLAGLLLGLVGAVLNFLRSQ